MKEYGIVRLYEVVSLSVSVLAVSIYWIAA